MSIRALRRSEIDRAAVLLQRMVAEMAALGGPPTKGKADVVRWFSDRIRETFDDPDHLWLVAVSDGPAHDLVGLLEAAVTVPSEIFLPTLSLHIHAVYVDPDHRRLGVARTLLEGAFAWGRDHHCEEADLHVLYGSPARALYEAVGFQVVEIAMRRDLHDIA